jgi:hypothetical protein
MQRRIVMGSLIALAIASNAYARPQGIGDTPGPRCPREDLACPSRVVANEDRQRPSVEHAVDLRSWLYDPKGSGEPPAQRDDASGGADLMALHPAGNVLWLRW